MTEKGVRSRSGIRSYPTRRGPRPPQNTHLARMLGVKKGSHHLGYFLWMNTILRGDFMKVFQYAHANERRVGIDYSGEFKIYACGPTVYNLFHLGNARPFITYIHYADILNTVVTKFTTFKTLRILMIKSSIRRTTRGSRSKS